ncbi:MAG: YggT family protein [Actinobacteria bacterium]|nr:YggT family protein [Actinomycetota bacterium]MBV9936665.1 YggT family protein [Actinomycetota bacterium]
MRLLGNLIDIYLLLLIGRILLSWFPISPESPMSTVFSFLYRITEPVLGPIRRMLPPIGMGGVALDLSPIIVIFGLEILKNALVR